MLKGFFQGSQFSPAGSVLSHPEQCLDSGPGRSEVSQDCAGSCSQLKWFQVTFKW